MNEEIKARFVNKALEYLNSAEAFLKTEVPAYVQELLMYNFYSNLFTLVLSIIGLILITIVGFKSYKSYYSDEGRFYTILLFGAISMFTLAYGVRSIDNLIKIKVAPRVFLIEYLTGK